MKTWLITGCSTGLGRSLAKAVLQKGDNVVVTARDTKKLEEFEKDFPRTALIVRLDVTDLPSVTEAVRAAKERFGGIDVLVNNAGYGYRAAVEEGTPEGLYHRLCRAVPYPVKDRYLRLRGDGGNQKD